MDTLCPSPESDSDYEPLHRGTPLRPQVLFCQTVLGVNKQQKRCKTE